MLKTIFAFGIFIPATVFVFWFGYQISKDVWLSMRHRDWNGLVLCAFLVVVLIIAEISLAGHLYLSVME